MLHDITADMKRACESILPAFVEATTQMIARFDPEFQAKIRKNIVLAGGGSLIAGIREYFQTALKEYGTSSVTCVSDPLFAGSDGALKLAQEMPAQYWEKL
jgi:rod shape-determining protein MreB